MQAPNPMRSMGARRITSACQELADPRSTGLNAISGMLMA